MLVEDTPPDMQANFEYALWTIQQGRGVETGLGFSPELYSVLQAYGMDPTNPDYLDQAKKLLADDIK